MTRAEALEQLVTVLGEYLQWESDRVSGPIRAREWQKVKDAYAAVAQAEPDRERPLAPETLLGLLEQAEEDRDALLTDVKRLRSALIELMAWGVEFDDERLGYLNVQVSRPAIDEAKAALAPPPTETEKGVP